MSNFEVGKGDGPHKMRDSGLGSLGSESDTSPSQPVHLTAAVNTSQQMQSTTLLAAVDVMTGNLRNLNNRKYHVTYLGYIVLDRRYTQPQYWKSFIPWLVAEVKRKPNPHQLYLQVIGAGSYTLNGYDGSSNKLLFEHKLQHLSKFSRIHRDTKCFVYLTKGKLDDFICHVYQVADESLVVSLFENIREATKQAISDPTQTTANVECSSEYAKMTPASLFEIMYIGKMPVVAKKAAPTFIDETVEKFILYEEKKQKQVIEQERKRHASGTSVKSLPSNLDQNVSVKENELSNRSVENVVTNGSNVSLESNGSGGSGDGLSGSSSENILNNNAVPVIKTEVIDLYEGLGKADADNLQRMAVYNQGKKKKVPTATLR